MKGIGRPIGFVLLSILISFTFVVKARAQSGVSTGSILGSVTDASGAVVPGAKVVVESDTGYQRTMVTATDGTYQALLLPKGNYEVTVTRRGFKTFARKNLALSVDQNLRVDVILEVGATTQSVTVTGGASQVDTHSFEPSVTVSEPQLKELPLGTHRYLQTAALSPGVVPGYQRIGVPSYQYYNWLGADPQSSGAPFQMTDFQIDSTSMHQGIWGGSGGVPTSVSIAEVKVIRNSFSAEYGTGAGLVINAVTKSGSNQFHGELFDILGNDAFNSRTFRSGSQKPFLRYNQFGGDVGGPVVLPHLYNGKDKTFFYFDYEGIRQPASAVVSGGYPPTTAEKSGDFSALATPIIDPLTGNQFAGNKIPAARLDPAAQYYLQKMPLANVGTEYRQNYPTPKYENQYTVRIDQNLGSKDRLFGRWWTDHPQISLAGGTMPILPSTFQSVGATNRSLTLNNTYAFSPTLLSQSTFAYVNIKQNFGPAASTAITDYTTQLPINGWDTDNQPQIPPTVRISGYNLNVETGNPSQQYDTNYLLSQTLTWLHGRHALKFGFEFGHGTAFMGVGPNGNGRERGVFSFNGQYTGNALADFVLGLPSNVYRGDGISPSLSSNNYAGFVQDDFKVSRKLTLNLGVRYRVDVPWKEKHHYGGVFIAGQQSKVIPNAPVGLNYVGDKGVPATFYPTDYNDWAPRFGFAYDPTGSGKTSIRGGFGIYYNYFPWFPAFTAAQTAPYGDTVNFTPTSQASFSNPFAGRTDPYPFVFNPSKATFNLPVTIDPTLNTTVRSTYMESWSFGVQHQVKGMLVEVDYVGSVGRKILNASDVNVPQYIPGTNPATGLPFSTVQNEDQRRPIAPGVLGRIVLNTDYASSTYNALEVSSSGHLAHNLLVTSAWTWGHSLDDNSWGRFMDVLDSSNPLNFRDNWGNSDYDYRHIFTASVVWNLPQLSGAPVLLRGALGNWAVSTLFTAKTGSFMTVYSGVDNSLTGVGWDRANALLPRSQWINAAAVTRGQKVDNYINAAAFGLNPIGTFGNVGRNTMEMPGGWVDDMTLGKKFPIHESLALNFRATFYNTFNHTRLSGYTYNRGAVLNPVNSPNFTKLPAVWLSGRTIQFEMGLNF